MPRPLRIEYPGAIYHLMSRGDHSEPIFRDDIDRRLFIKTLGQVCEKTGCLMGNHFHLVAETPQPNLVQGMKWFLGTYTSRFNRRHCLAGHLFSGRYKSVLVDERGGGYLRTACDYVHLNPVRAGLLAPDQPLSAFRWSSFPHYLVRRSRPVWLRVDRLLGEHGTAEDSAAGRMEFQARMEKRRAECDSTNDVNSMRRGWKLGAADFVELLAERLGRPGQKDELARERRETDQQRAEQLVRERLRASGWTEADLAARPKGDPWKVELALRLRRQTPMTRKWIADRLQIGSVSYVSHLLAQGSDCRL